MMKHEQMIPLIGDLFINAYVAGDRKDTNTYSNARASRDHMYEAVAELYCELESESYHREQFELELKKANEELGQEKEHVQSLYSTIRKLQNEIQRLHEERYVMADATALNNLFKDSTPEDLKEAFAKYATIPDDGGKFSEQDLPFPDVDDLAPASEVLGGDE